MILKLDYVFDDNFLGVLETMILKLDNIFDTLFCFFALWEVQLEILFSLYFMRHTFWIDSSSFKKIQKMNRHLLGKSLDIFPQNENFFLQIVMIILKVNVTLKSLLGMQFFTYLNQRFPWDFLCS